MVSTRKRTGATASNATDQPRAQGALAHDHEHAHAHAHSHAHVTAADAEDGNTSKKRRVDAPASAAVVESALSEDEMALYDRQIRLWGLEAQTKMRSARVLVVGMTGIANEICKNITLAGIGNLTLMDSRNVEPSDLGAQFLLAESDIGTNIAVAAAGRIRLLNPRVHINILVDEVSSKQEEFYRDFEIVVVTSKLAFSTMCDINNSCRRQGTKFMSCAVFGTMGYIFSDLLDYEYIEERNQTSDGITTTKREKKEISFRSLETASTTKFSGVRSKILKRVSPVFFGLQLLWESERQLGRLPASTSGGDVEQLLLMRKEYIKSTGGDPQTIENVLSESFVQRFAQQAQIELSPVCAIVGGIAGQDLLNVVSGKEVDFLAGGYGSRLQRDIDNDTSGRYSHLKGVSKALLPLRGTPLISHWITLLNAWNVEEKSDAFSGFEPLVICNASNHEQFKEWARTTGFKEASIFNDGTTSNEGRHGAVTDLSLAISYFNLQDPSKFKAVLVVAGDTLFLKDFSLKQFVTLAISMGEARKGDKAPCLVASYTVLRDIDTLKTGIIETDDTDSLRGGGAEGRRVTSLIEKPDPSETTSRLACPCFYYLSSDSVGLVGQFVKASVSRGEPMEKRDATGRFIEWLVRVHPVYTTSVSGRLDIGGLASYIEAEEYLSDANSKRPELRQLGDETKSASIALKLVSSKSGSSISTSVVSKVQKSMLRVPATPRLCALFSSSASAASAASAPSRTAPDLRSIAFDATAGVPVEAGSAHAARAALLAAALPLVPELGFSDSALRAAARSLSLSPIAAGLCTRGPVELAEFLVTETTSAVSQQMRAAPEFEKMRVHEKIRFGVLARIHRMQPYAKQWADALALMALPQNVSNSLFNLTQLVDEIWHVSGDTSVDMNWYSKRATLAAVYTSTELFMTQDKSPGFVETERFLDRRLKDVAVIGRTSAEISSAVDFGIRSFYGVLSSRGIRL